MNWDQLLSKLSGQPLFHSSLLRAFEDNPGHIQVQISRWVKQKKLVQIRRGWYLIGEPYRTKEVSEAVMANTVVQPSYLSLDWALHFHGLIPEAVFQPTSLTTRRGIQFSAAGRFFIYHHIQPAFFTGYRQFDLAGEKILSATPEKALLDKIYIFLQAKPFSLDWLRELRLQNLDKLDQDRWSVLAARSKKPGFAQAAKKALDFIEGQRG
jgi:hypothetical protein